jgi:sec-independent protein translocase protein TatA
LFAILDFGTTELMVIGLIAVMLFGKNLPDVGRSIGKQLGAFRRGLQGIENEIRSTTGGLGLPTTKIGAALSTLDSLTRSASTPTSSSSSALAPRNTVAEVISDVVEPTAPKFEPPPG